MEIEHSLVAFHLGLAYWIGSQYEEAEDVLERNITARKAWYGPNDTNSFQ
jgi:hypothetical protein